MGIPAKVKRALILRSRGLCEARLDGCARMATDPHHRKLASRGGGDNLVNLLAVCRPCHDKIHAHAPGTGRFRTHSWQLEGQHEDDDAR